MSKMKPSPTTSATRALDFSGDSDYDLLEMMTWHKEDRDSAREAWAEFYRRHIEYMYGVCWKSLYGVGGVAAARDLAQETFRRVFESGAATFKRSPSSDPQASRVHVRAWLGRIAANIAKSAYRNRKETDGIQIEQEQWQDVAGRDPPEDSPQVKRLVKIMERILTDRERDILRTTFHWYKPGEDHQRVPDDVMSDLARRWDATPENIRQIRVRALRKLKEAVAAEGGSFSCDGQLTSRNDRERGGERA